MVDGLFEVDSEKYYTCIFNILDSENVIPVCSTAATGPKFTILWGHVEEILLLNKFFSDCR